MINSLDKAFQHCIELAEKYEEECKNWIYGASRINDDEGRKMQYLKHAEMWEECASDQRQLAEWLVELKAWRRVGELLNELLTKEQIKKLKEKRRNDT